MTCISTSQWVNELNALFTEQNLGITLSQEKVPFNSHNILLINPFCVSLLQIWTTVTNNFFLQTQVARLENITSCLRSFRVLNPLPNLVLQLPRASDLFQLLHNKTYKNFNFSIRFSSVSGIFRTKALSREYSRLVPRTTHMALH